MRSKRGELVPIRDASPQARHHFTQADQVNQLVGASEADPDLGFMARLMALCSLPRTIPGDRIRYKRVNGTKKGYQRELSKSRVNRLEKELLYNRVDLPTAVLLSMRGGNQDSLIPSEKGLHLKLDNHPLNVVDGQHRVASLRRLVEQNPEKWSDFRIPFVCVLGANELQEREQFYVVNSTAKSVRTDLAYDLLKQRAENDPNVVTVLEERGETWKVTGKTIVERLAAESILWGDRIRFPGEPKATTTINNSGMVNSLNQLLSAPYFAALTTDNQFKVLEAYWQGICAVLPDCFAAPTEYVIQKSTGVMILHTLLLSVIEHVRSFGDSVIESRSYERVLETPLMELQEDNRAGNLVSGSEFWLVGSSGAAGAFSSNAGRRVLLAKVRHLLPKIEIE